MTAVLPAAVATIMAQENLELERVIRDGPRYWVGRVRRGATPLILKTVVRDDPWQGPLSAKQFRPSDQLRAEIVTLEELGRHAGELRGRAPVIHARAVGEKVWSLREVVGGPDMAAGFSPFVFAPVFYKTVSPAELVAYIESYQRLTPELAGHIATSPRSYQMSLRAKMIMAGLDNPQPSLQPCAAAAVSYLNARQMLHDQAGLVLTHGELYPPHIFYDGEVCVIDWENAALGNAAHDFVAVWIRAYADGQWQARFLENMAQHRQFSTPQWQQLWDLEVVYQAAGALNYLDWSYQETPAQAGAAAAWLQAELQATLAQQDGV